MAKVGAVGGQRVFDDDQLQVRVLTAQSREQALGGVALAVVFRRPIGLEDRLGSEWEHLFVVRRHQHRAEHLVIVGRGAVAMVFLGALRAVDRRRGEVARAVERKPIMVIVVGKPLQPLAALQLTEQRRVQRAQVARIQRIEALAKARVTRGALDSVECFEIRPRRLFPAAVLELQQRGILQPEQRQPRHQMIDQRNRVAGCVGDLPEHLPHRVQQTFGAELLA